MVRCVQSELFAPAQAGLSACSAQAGCLTLRPYQQECLDAIRGAVGRGVRRQLMTLPTGAGKTVVFSRLPQTLNLQRMLVLAHREELLDQAAAHLTQANPAASVEIEQADRRASSNASIVVASVPTLGRVGARIERWNPNSFDAIVIDEAHHATADTYRRICRYFQAGQLRGPLLLGVTATPFRGDGEPLANVFDEVVYEATLRGLIEAGYLCRIRALRVRSAADVSDVGTRLGDFAEGELATAVNTDYRNSLICSAIEKHAADRQCILVFAVNVAHVEDLTTQLQKRGHTADFVTAETPTERRRDILARARAGELRMLLGVGVFTEGFDLPRIDCVVMARPTKSPLLYQQMLGRGCRNAPGKPDLLVLDVADVCGRHQVQTAGTAFGMRRLDLLGEDVLSAAATCERAAKLGITVDDGEDLSCLRNRLEIAERLATGTVRVQTETEAIELFRACALAPEVKAHSCFPWLRVGERYYLAVGSRDRWMLWRDALGMWRCDGPGSTGLNCGAEDDVPWKLADQTVKRFTRAGVTPAGVRLPGWHAWHRDARWRRREISAAQRRALWCAGFRALPPGLTRGGASQLLDYVYALRNGNGKHLATG